MTTKEQIIAHIHFLLEWHWLSLDQQKHLDDLLEELWSEAYDSGNSNWCYA
jgi:hypothetical protein